MSRFEIVFGTKPTYALENVFGADTTTGKDWLEVHYESRIRTILKTITNIDYKVSFVLRSKENRNEGDKMYKDVVLVRPANNFKLLLEFEGREFRVFDFLAYGKTKKGLPLEILNNINLFESVKLDGTGTIYWDNKYDLAIEFLYNTSVLVSELL
ncbi:DUF2442 domain-containing protein [Paenibacillus sp. FSL R5-0345]